jgi:hypothetical protein
MKYRSITTEVVVLPFDEISLYSDLSTRIRVDKEMDNPTVEIMQLGGEEGSVRLCKEEIGLVFALADALIKEVESLGDRETAE